MSIARHYVGSDVVTNPDDVDCGSYDNGTAKLDDTSNSYWCRYDANLLETRCHSQTCQPRRWAVCLKRASRTGGCDAIAETIRCRGLQADLAHSDVEPEDVLSEGCSPCVVLPFSPLPRECPELSTAPASPSANSYYRIALESVYKVRDDFIWSDGRCSGLHGGGAVADHPECLELGACADPPPGRLVWNSSHPSGQAVVNLPLVLSVADIPTKLERYPFPYLEVPREGGSGEAPHIQFWSYRVLAYEESDTIMRTWPKLEPDAEANAIDSFFGNRSSCRGYDDWPEFRVIVEELWPDTDSEEIERLFGVTSLDWWRDAASSPGLQERATESRDFVFVDCSATSPTRDCTAERERRRQQYSHELTCNHGGEVWCRWTPTRPGYYRLTLTGGWLMTTYFRPRQWLTYDQTETLTDILEQDSGRCLLSQSYVESLISTGFRPKFRNRECLELGIRALMQAEPGLSPADFGLTDDLRSLLPFPANVEELYRTPLVKNASCDPRDLRVRCSVDPVVGVNYTESDPIGILVHEVRVSTVMPSR